MRAIRCHCVYLSIYENDLVLYHRIQLLTKYYLLKFIIFYRTVQAYVSREDSLDLSHYKLWYKVQHDRIRSQNTHTANISNRIARQKSEINNGFDGTDSENLTVSTACSEGAFSTPFVGR